MFRRRILMNCVDTGWVTDMAPEGVGQVAATHETWVGPPLDEEERFFPLSIYMLFIL